MKLVRNSLLLLALSASLLGLAGCESSGEHGGATSSSPAPRYTAVTAFTPHGPPIVYLKPNDMTPLTVMASPGATDCPDCHKAAEAYFAGGKLADKCQTCGATLQAVNGR